VISIVNRLVVRQCSGIPCCLLQTMSSFKDPNTFADPEDSELVRKCKRIIGESIHFKYTEVNDRNYVVLLPNLNYHVA
jgi:hypothetical protein